jgi:predicted HTH transcriptional regulator
MLVAVNLTPLDLLSCMSKGEGTRVEFKRRLPRDDRAARTLCAFANTRGGLLIVGVTDRGRVHGVHHPDEVIEKLSSLGETLLMPALRFEIQIVEVHGPRVVACSVPFSKERPHAVLMPDGERQFLVRVGASNRIADGPTLAALRLQRRGRRGLSTLEEAIVAWVRHQARSSAHPGGTATAARFARLHNIGEVRARRAFVKLEGLGLLIGHGSGRARIFTTP